MILRVILPFRFLSRRLGLLVVLGALTCGAQTTDWSPEAMRLRELNQFWARVSHAVLEGDFKGYRATCHPDGVLISGADRTTTLLEDALRRWKAGFEETRAGRMSASVRFRFSRRTGNTNAAHEIGIFRYATDQPGGTSTVHYVHFEALLVRRPVWKVLVEDQKGPATEAEWNDLEKTGQ